MESEAKDVSRSTLIGHWHAGKSCDSSLVLEKGGSARWKHWATGYSVSDARVTGREDSQGSWTLQTVKDKQYFEVKRGHTFEPLTVLQGEGQLILLQIPGDDPGNSIGCRFERVEDHKPN